MTIALCIDDKNGMMFNRRRQSRDSALISDLVELCKDKRIIVNEYSLPLFRDYPQSVITDPDPLGNAGEDDVCFIENISPDEYLSQIDCVILYRWNRHYPSDKKFTMSLSGFTLQSQKEFIGTSHDTITREVYVR